MKSRLRRSLHGIISHDAIRHYGKYSASPVTQHWKARLPQWERDPTYHRVVPPRPRELKMPHIPQQITRPHYSETGKMSPWDDIIPLAYPIGPEEWYDEHLIEGMRNACRMASKCLEFATTLVEAGVTTTKINEEVMKWAFKNNCYPSSLNYGGFPASLCTSVNNVLSHGVPNDQPLKEGSIVNLDIALYVPYEPAQACYHGDTSTTVAVGGIKSVSQHSKKLLKATRYALEAGIQACGPWKPYNGIGKAIADVAAKYDLVIVPGLSGHGIGKEYHQHPLILHTYNDDPGEMAPGTIFTIEPCLTEGDGRYEVDPEDGWSLYSVDGSRGAQEEHTLMITENGVEVLTDRIA